MLHLSDGEYWLILPRYPGTALEVSQLDINTSEARLVYSDPDCEALILQCNISDIFPDAEIRLRGRGSGILPLYLPAGWLGGTGPGGSGPHPGVKNTHLQ